jgi:hypothetical protein
MPSASADQPSLGRWVNGFSEWTDGDTAYLSIAFTWQLDNAYQRAVWWRSLGYHVVAGGPALFQEKVRHRLDRVAEIPTKTIIVDGRERVVGADHPSGEAVVHHNPMATRSEELPDFPVRPVLCDNNLSALSPKYQDFIIARYQREGVPLLDANSGFEPRTFDDEVYARWRAINKGPWRFAYDETSERPYVERVMRMLAHLSPRKKQVYTLIGNEPFDACMERIAEVRAWGGEPYAQPVMKLNAPAKRPWVRHDWTEARLLAVQRWCNYSSRAGVTWAEYNSSAKTRRRDDGPELPGIEHA